MATKSNALKARIQKAASLSDLTPKFRAKFRAKWKRKNKLKAREK